MPVRVSNPIFKNGNKDFVYLGSSEQQDYYFSPTIPANLPHDSLVIKLSDLDADFVSMSVQTAKTLIKENQVDEDSVFASCYKKYLSLKRA